MRLVIRRVSRHNLSVAVIAWHSHVRTEATQMGKMRRIAGSMVQRASVHAVQEWKLKVQAHRAKHRAETLLRRTAGRIVGRDVVLAYGEWARNCRADQQTVLQTRCKRLQQEKQQLSLKISAFQPVQ